LKTPSSILFDEGVFAFMGNFDYVCALI
jgi:hypothetical protein